MPHRVLALATVLSLTFVTSLGLVGAASAATCTSGVFGPSDPGYAPAERNPGDPQESFNTEQWYLLDCVPQSAPLAVEPTGSAGMRVNKAWQEYGYGSDKVLVAYMEGGINWRRADTAPELRKRSWLNTRELPRPRRADGSTATSYDLNGDGVVDVDDWKDDPRVRRPLLHAATAGGITPEDLIVAFSDGTDADRNGYVDDIAGWNFHRDTNDPQTDQSIYNHANSEMALAVGEKDNGVGGSGMCPRCRLLPVKIGDEAIDRTDRVAQGIVFAVDSGAKVIVGVSVSLGETAELGAAFRYAYSHGAVVAWASNDFESADHTDGMSFDHVWPGNGLVADQTNRQSTALPNDRLTQTFRARSTVTSYGPHNLFSVASKNGSTSASTPGQGGVAALVYSAGVATGTDLDADEVKQVVRSTVTDIATTPVSTAGAMFPAQPGFDIQYGYGRPDVYAAVRAVHQGRIPPTADLVAPRWYASADPTRQRALPITARVAARRAGSYRYEVQYGLGPQPTSFTTIARGTGTTARTVSARLDLTRLPRSFWDGTYAVTPDRLSIERYDVTIRVQVTDSRGLLGEDRKAVVVRHDSSELPGFPRAVGQGGEPQPTLADLDGDGALEVVVATADGTVTALRPDGRVLPGYPVRTRTAPGFDVGRFSHGVSYAAARGWRSGQPRPRDPIATTPAVGDLDHDGGLDVVVSTTNGRVYAWDGAGRLRPGFPVQTSRAEARQAVPVPDTPYQRGRSAGAFGSPVLADLDGDRDLEVVLGGWDGRVYAWTRTGALLPGWPADTGNPDRTVPPGFVYARDHKVATTPAVADVDGDGRQDVIVALADTSFPEPVNEGPVTGYVTAFGHDGRLLDGYPVRIPAAVQGYGTAQDFITEGVQTPVVYDGPTGPVLVANAGLAPAVTVDLRTRTVVPLAPPVFAPGGQGQLASPLVHFTTSASLGDLLGTGLPQAAQSGSAATDVATAVVATPGLGIQVRAGLTAYDLTSHAPLPGFATPKVLQGLPFLSAPALADVSGDGRPDVVIATDSAALHAYDGRTGAQVPGFPKWTGGWVLYTPAVGDLDGDGRVEVVATTREGYLHAWRTTGLATANHEAWHYHQDDRNTGHYGTDTRPPAGVRGLRLDGSTLSFTSPGDDWNTGTPAGYQVFRSDRPLTQDTLASAQRLPLTTSPVLAGERVRLTVPAGGYYAVRAVDDAGNLGPVLLRAAGAVGPRPSGRPLASTGSSPQLATAGAVLVLGCLVLARRARRPLRV